MSYKEKCFTGISFYLLRYLPFCVWTTIVMTLFNTYFKHSHFKLFTTIAIFMS